VLVPSDALFCTVFEFGELSVGILKAGRSVRFKARGSSMVPLIRDGDNLLVEPVENTSLRVGDILLCSVQSDRVIVHRVVKRCKADGKFLLQGDRVPEPDGWIDLVQILGRVTEIERGGVQLHMNEPAARFLAVCAVWNSRWQLSQHHRFYFFRKWIKRLTLFEKYLT
jgi:signal peptidase I